MSVQCPYCSREFKGCRVNSRHLSKCNPSLSPKVDPCLCGHEATSLTQMKRHRRTCQVWKDRDAAAVAQRRRERTLQERYGVSNPRAIPEAEERRRETVRERYGADNVFSRESSVYQKVQQRGKASRKPLHGQDNPFSKPEVQQKIRRTMKKLYGAAHPQQAPSIRARTRATNKARYGYAETLASPALRAKGRQTSMERYGVEYPQQSDEVKARIQSTNLERYGVPWTAMDPEVRRKQLEAMEARWGGHFFASEEGKQIVREALREMYGVENPSQIEGFWDKAVATFQERYGVDHPLQLPEFLAKARATCERLYGTPFPGLMKRGPNLLEQKVHAMCPALLFTGDGSWWRRLPLLDGYKNPDFIVPGPDPAKPKKGITKVVEVFGDFWHSRMFTGRAPFDHEQELVDAFAAIGIECLVLWESEVRKSPETVRERLLGFVS